jgi:hypothetical protein
MSVKGPQKLTPQVEEQIHEIKWVKLENLGKYINNAFPSVADVLRSLSKTENIDS